MLHFTPVFSYRVIHIALFNLSYSVCSFWTFSKWLRNSKFPIVFSSVKANMSVCVCTCTYMKWSEVKVTQSCLTLCDPMDSTVHGILQAKTLEWVTFYRGPSQPRDGTQVSHIAGRFFPSWASREAQEYGSGQPIRSPADLPDPGIELGSPALKVDSLPTQLSEKPLMCIHMHMHMYSHMCVYICMYVHKCSVHTYNWPLLCGYYPFAVFFLCILFKKHFHQKAWVSYKLFCIVLGSVLG